MTVSINRTLAILFAAVLSASIWTSTLAMPQSVDSGSTGPVIPVLA
ncbi:MAG: hypothetical protein KDE55_01955 [Novosphingobium sp.]|nr:hypothetical protein [Novosphingobium sp.]